MTQTFDTDAQAETRLRVVRYFSDLCSELVPASVRQEHLDQVRELEGMSDTELLQLGIFRDEIVDYVFREARYV